MVNARAKGSSYERDVRKRLRDSLGLDFNRVYQQASEAGLPDLICDDPSFPFVIECKRYQKTSAFADPRWWDQICYAAKKYTERRQVLRPHEKPVFPALVYKGDRLEERWRIPVEAIAGLKCYDAAGDKAEAYNWTYAVEMSFRDFCMIARELMCD